MRPKVGGTVKEAGGGSTTGEKPGEEVRAGRRESENEGDPEARARVRARDRASSSGGVPVDIRVLAFCWGESIAQRLIFARPRVAGWSRVR